MSVQPVVGKEICKMEAWALWSPVTRKWMGASGYSKDGQPKVYWRRCSPRVNDRGGQHWQWVKLNITAVLEAEP